ncbi:uncharacterized protein [Antedon mediterranea]|uniref:uncharacterized protein n=1 Tax=Antedon mediterranea TaxID=105859 RepID=UPI003AF9B49A
MCHCNDGNGGCKTWRDWMSGSELPTDVISRQFHVFADDGYDSQTVLKYIHKTSRRFKAFVANRVSIILNISKASEWRYVRTCNNPADEASRGQRIEEFLSNTRWRNGPEFLRDKCEQWIDLQAKSLPLIAEDDPEIKGVSNVLVPACTSC